MRRVAVSWRRTAIQQSSASEQLRRRVGSATWPLPGELASSAWQCPVEFLFRFWLGKELLFTPELRYGALQTHRQYSEDPGGDSSERRQSWQPQGEAL